MSKVDKTEIDEQIAASIKNFSSLAKDEAARARFIIDMPEFIQRKAQMISAHFLLPAGARLADMGCETGEVTYMLAALNPRIEVIGIDRDAALIDFARKTYKLPNLSFRVADLAAGDLEDGTVDAIINSNVLHHIYSSAGYSEDEVVRVLEKQIQKLKSGGTMLIRDYIMPPQEEFVLLEVPAGVSTADNPLGLSDADLLVRFSQTARPLATGCEGFFIEELPPRRAETRLFRLPHKWALEFVHRKNYRAHWDKELHTEYTFFTLQDYRREFARLGMRMVFSAPYSNPWVIKNCFKGRFQLYDEAYASLSFPATNYFIVAQKVSDKQSLILEERRPSQKPVGDLQIIVVRDNKTGALHELVKRPGEYCDVVPYRVTPDNRVLIYVRSGYPRPLVNAVARGSHNLDGKKWSGHLVEPVTMDTVEMTDDIEDNRQMIFGYVESYAGLRPKGPDKWSVGETYFPSPERIDEAIEPVFIEVENPNKTLWPIAADKDIGFTELGAITELDAADIILAAHVGLLPEPRLELHAIELLNRHNIPLPRWSGDIGLKLEKKAVRVYEPEDLLEELEPTTFEKEKKSPVYLKAVKSVFVEEGRVGRSLRGLAAQDIEFVVTEDGIENIAIVLPVARDWDDNLLVAIEPKILPVPNRLGGDGAMLTAPSFVLPKNIKTVEEARLFVAQKFKIELDSVVALGESYFTHTGVMPQRVYPFIISATGEASAGPKWRYTMARRLHRLGWFSRSAPGLLRMLADLKMTLDDNNDAGAQRTAEYARHKGYSLSTDKVAIENKNAGYSAVPSRILGQRGKADPELQAEGQAVQALIEDLVAPRVGRRLSQSFKPSDNKMTLTMTPVTEKADKDIESVGDKLKKSVKENKPATLELTPPDPSKKTKK